MKQCFTISGGHPKEVYCCSLQSRNALSAMLSLLLAEKKFQYLRTDTVLKEMILIGRKLTEERILIVLPSLMQQLLSCLNTILAAHDGIDEVFTIEGRCRGLQMYHIAESTEKLMHRGVRQLSQRVTASGWWTRTGAHASWVRVGSPVLLLSPYLHCPYFSIGIVFHPFSFIKTLQLVCENQ